MEPDMHPSEEEKQLWEYFASLYKNSNKGIKGRGKDRRINAIPSPTISSSSSYTPMTATSHNRHYAGAYHSGSDRGSRCSSISSDSTARVADGYDFNTSLQGGFQAQSHGYNDMVFPERKLY
jgi:hypothetical protein